jgi:hypothetical protein
MPLSYGRARRYWRKPHAAPFLINEDWVNNYAAPFADPKLCEPGPGSWRVSDAGLNMTTNLGSLVYAGAMPGAWDVCMLISTLPFARHPGRYLEFEFTPNTAAAYVRVGFNRASNPTIQENEATVYIGGGGFINVTDGLDVVAPLYPYSLGTSYVFRIYDTGSGFRYYVRTTLGGTSAWTLLWERETSLTHLTTLYPCFNNHSQTGTVDYVRVRQGLLKPAILTAFTPGKAWYGQGAADGLLTCTVLAPRNADRSLYFRVADSANYWRAKMDTTLGNYDLVRCVAGVETVVATTAVTWASGTLYELKVLTFGTYIRCFWGINSGPTFTSAANQTATLCGLAPATGTAPTANDGDFTRFTFQTGGALLLN